MLWLIPFLLLCSTVRAQDDECTQGHEQCGHEDVFDQTVASASSDVTFINTRPKSTTVRNVPSPDTPNIYPSAPCRVARSAGFSFAGGALSGGTSHEDRECTLRETARSFQLLGVPEVGLILLCENSVVITGRTDKKGRLLEGEHPIGTEECLRLVRQFQGGDDGTDEKIAVAAEVEALKGQQDNFEQRLDSTIEQLERSFEQHRVVTAASAPIVQQPYLNESKRSKLAALFGDNDEETTE